MTLPAYAPVARPNEQILAREGERAGIDVVVEFPETHEEEEERRDEEMESLYQIRLARRQENAEREERRRQRREARDRGDFETLRRLREDARRRAESLGGETIANQLIAEHQAKDRQRRVSSVQYAELGVARHDGTRLRANSSESDNRPLLDGAAAMEEGRPGSSRTLTIHSRGRSASSVISLSSNASDEPARSQSNESGHTDFEVINLTNTNSGSSHSPPAHSSADVGEMGIPPPEPPRYDDLGWDEAPPYSSPVDTRAPHLPSNHSSVRTMRTAPQLPDIDRVPSIQITESLTPVDRTPSSGFEESVNHEQRR
ncbi:hypothetical protein M501DRAFT_1010586 [Patellaria atrata CBS 101060]|uniref:Uncharacterized protein n=1 Tax=Patellaria atrata CBS 101060 TaxID=1346257 RepID=A0A9P4SDL8_9PEZI|nr:hypothetical protein M501DRAFT_1010586 [Patellaria atrata CBS 101060]